MRKKRQKRTWADVVRLTKERAVESKKKYLFGRKLIQTEIWYGLAAGRACWVISEWPKTAVIFDDGRITHMSEGLDKVLKETDEYVKDPYSVELKVSKARVSRKL